MTKNIRNAIKNIVVKDVDGDSTIFMKLFWNSMDGQVDGSSFKISESVAMEGRQE
ncbi:MAG: hypothetical protein K2J90_08320 [Lachnospiraceae bacterium]|nr:hypothetical protein [Lachnospiraceae bacterium]